MMKGTYVVLVSMAGALVWFFWQRRHSRRRADISGDGEARSDHVAQETSIAAPDTGHSLASTVESTFKPPSEQTGEVAREPDLEIQPVAAAGIEPDRQTEEISVAQPRYAEMFPAEALAIGKKPDLSCEALWLTRYRTGELPSCAARKSRQSSGGIPQRRLLHGVWHGGLRNANPNKC